MQSENQFATMIIKDGWVICPFCRKKKILHLGHETLIRNLPWTCGRCGKTILVNIDPPEPASKETSA